MRPPALLALAVPLVLAPASLAQDAGRKERPFPVEKSATLSEEKVVYTVEGRVRIRKGVLITCQKDVHIKAKGGGPAVLEVEGSLQARGVATREVIFDGVFVEPCEKFESVRLDSCWFRNGGGVRTPEATAVDGEQIFVELCDFSKGAGFDVSVLRGEVTLSSICTDGPTRIRAVKAPGATESRVHTFVRGSGQGGKCTNHMARVGFAGGLEVDGGDDIMVQLSRTAGSLTAVRNWGRRLIFDGMKVNSDRLEFTHTDAGQMAKAQVAKLDVYSGSVLASAPLKPATNDTLKMDRCWFKGVTDPKEIFAKVIQDGEDDPAKNGVRVALPKVNDRPLELAGEKDR